MKDFESALRDQREGAARLSRPRRAYLKMDRDERGRRRPRPRRSSWRPAWPSPISSAAPPTTASTTTTMPSPTTPSSIEIDPKEPLAYINRGMALDLQGQGRRRDRRFRRGAEDQPRRHQRADPARLCLRTEEGLPAGAGRHRRCAAPVARAIRRPCTIALRSWPSAAMPVARSRTTPQALRTDQKNPRIYASRANLYSSLGEYDERDRGSEQGDPAAPARCQPASSTAASPTSTRATTARRSPTTTMR